MVNRLLGRYIVLDYFYAPNFEEDEEDIGLGLSVRACIRGSHFAYSQEWLEIGS